MISTYFNCFSPTFSKQNWIDALRQSHPFRPLISARSHQLAQRRSKSLEKPTEAQLVSSINVHVSQSDSSNFTRHHESMNEDAPFSSSLDVFFAFSGRCFSYTKTHSLTICQSHPASGLGRCHGWHIAKDIGMVNPQPGFKSLDIRQPFTDLKKTAHREKDRKGKTWNHDISWHGHMMSLWYVVIGTSALEPTSAILKFESPSLITGRTLANPGKVSNRASVRRQDCGMGDLKTFRKDRPAIHWSPGLSGPPRELWEGAPVSTSSARTACVCLLFLQVHGSMAIFCPKIHGKVQSSPLPVSKRQWSTIFFDPCWPLMSATAIGETASAGIIGVTLVRTAIEIHILESFCWLCRMIQVHDYTWYGLVWWIMIFMNGPGQRSATPVRSSRPATWSCPWTQHEQKQNQKMGLELQWCGCILCIYAHKSLQCFDNKSIIFFVYIYLYIDNIQVIQNYILYRIYYKQIMII